MKRKNKTISLQTLTIMLLISCFIVPICSSCKSRSHAEIESKGGYNCSFFDVPQKDGFVSRFEKIFFDDDTFCIVVLNSRVNEKNIIQEQTTDIYRVNEKGELLSTLEISGAQVPDAIVGDAFLFIGYDLNDLQSQENSNLSNPLPSLVFLNKVTGDYIKDIQLDHPVDSVISISNGFLVIGTGEIYKYSSDGSLEAELKVPFNLPPDGNPVFEENGLFFAVEETADWEFNYYSVDFNDGKIEKVITGNDAGTINARDFYGNRFFTSNGEYRVDCTNHQVLTLADWNEIDMRPEKKMLKMQPKFYSIDDDHFAKCYVYGDDIIELLLFSYDSNKEIYARQKIVLGGFGIYDDLPLGWAIYEFNTTNKSYKIEVDDYTGRFLDTSAPDARQEQLRLMKYFQDGNTPDIYYGDEFDYEYWGRSGMVVDLNPYIERDSSFSIDELTDVGKNLIFDKDGHCYQLFSSYRLSGYWMLRRDYENIVDTSFLSLADYSKEHNLLYNGTDDAIDILSDVLLHNYMDLFNSETGSSKMTKEKLSELIQCATSIGSYPYEFNPATESSLKNGEALLCWATVGEFESFEQMEKTAGDSLVFIGSPSVDSSLRIAEPKGLVAISTSSKNPDICWEFITKMFSEKVQKIVVLNQSIPVRQDVIDNTVDAFLHPDKIEDDSIKSLVFGFYRTKDNGMYAAEQWMIDDYLEAINSPERIKLYDWGIYSIVRDEINTYYSQGRSSEQIAETLYKRIKLYIEENYG